ncbi:rhodanese-like domain-containing protein [Roseateles sp. P5_E1]
MRTPLASLDALVHPHQIEVQEFRSYALVIDARSPEAFQEDHIPGAVNVPVGTGDRQAGWVAASIGVREAGPVLPYLLSGSIGHLQKGAELLVYCDRGGLDSLIWAEPLRSAGYVVDVLAGGWSSYRRWVAAGLDVLPRALTFRPLVAPPVSGMSKVVNRLSKRREQVIDLPAMAGQRLVPGLTLAGDKPPAQAAFETALVDAMRRLDPRRPVWVRVSLCGLGALVLPPALRDALLRSSGARLVVPLRERANAWSDCLRSKGAGTEQLLAAISASTMRPDNPVLERWRELSSSGQEIEALSEIITGYVEHCREAESWSQEPKVVALPSLAPESVATVVDEWCGKDGFWSSEA